MTKELLYHYTNFDAAKNIIESKNLRLMSSLGMEDKTDRFFANLYATIVLLTSQNSLVSDLRKHITKQEILDENISSLQIPFFSASFCQRFDNQYLWEHYAAENAGVCIAFDKELLLRHLRDVLCENFEPLDPDESAADYVEDLVPLRSVYYENAEEFVVAVMEDIHRVLKRPFENNRLPYKAWLASTYAIVSGVIKAKSFKNEEEIRLLFQNNYTNEFRADRAIYLFDSMRFKKGLSALGLCDLIKKGGRQYYELNLKRCFTSKLIPKIVLGKALPPENIEILKKTLIQNGLCETIVDEQFISSKVLI